MSRQIFGIICYVPDQPFQTPAIAEYARFLKARYHTCSIATVLSWPPTPSKKYIELAVIKQNRKINEKYIGHTLKGNIQEILKDRERITTNKIFDKQEPLFVIIEGAPGMGKSTLAWELCRKWEKLPHMKKYSLVILLRLRETWCTENDMSFRNISTESYRHHNTTTRYTSMPWGRSIICIRWV